MQNFKIVVSKNNKKYSLVLKAENESAARDRVHREGYSILTLQEISNNEDIGPVFVFEGFYNGEFKHGKIAGKDIFKAYVRLRKDLGYDIDYIYSERDENIPLSKKQEIITELREEYDLYFKGKKSVQVKKPAQNLKTQENFDLSNFYLNKELSDTKKLIDKVLIKMDTIFSGKDLSLIDSEKKEKLRLIYNEIIKLQKSTNISKLREIGELALTKIGEIELEELEKTKNKEDKDLLNETNKLLKSFGSKNQFIERDKDIKYQVSSIWNTLKDIFRSQGKEKSKKGIIENDINSYVYVKNLLYLNKYKNRLKENTKFIIKNLFKIITNKELREETFLIRGVVKQNIVLLQARQNGINFSYTFVKKGVYKLFDKIVLFFKALQDAIFIIIFSYTLIFILYFILVGFFNLPDFSINGLFLLIILILAYLSILISNNLLMLIICFVFLTFIIIFGVINF